MAEVEHVASIRWASATAVEHVASLPWGVATPLETVGSPFTPVGGGSGTPIGTGSLEPKRRIDARKTYTTEHTLSALDLRDNSVLDIDSATIAFDDGSTFWTLSATAGGAVFDKLIAGDQPPTVSVTIDGMEWQFAVESVSRPRAFASDAVTFGGRSISATADTPYEFERQWISDAPTTAAQVSIGAQTLTGLEVRWFIDDWAIPEGVMSFQGSPLGVVRYVAGAAGAQVIAARADFAVDVVPRYQLQPAQWACVPPDVQVAFAAVISETYERADKPNYNGVYLSGQQQGIIGFARAFGTSGADLAPMVTDPLLTDAPALRMRAESMLGGYGAQARITRVLPVLTGAGEPGVFAPGWIGRWVDPTETWFGVVRAVSVTATLGFAVQTVAIERHYVVMVPGAPPLLVFAGPIPDEAPDVGAAFSLALAGFWTGGLGARTYSVRTGTLPAGLTLDTGTGVISGTPTSAGTSTITIRVVDSVFQRADSTEFDIAPT